MRVRRGGRRDWRASERYNAIRQGHSRLRAMSDEITLGNISSLSSPATDLIARAAGPLIEGDYFFRELINALPAAVYTTDPYGRITYYNEAAAALWGCRPELGKSDWCGSWKLFWPDGRVLPHDQCPMAVAVKEQQAIRGVEAVAERADGTRVPFLPFPTPIFNASGVFVGAVNMLVDITERKRAEEATQRLAAIVDSSDDAIVSKDLDGIITSWNKGAERIFGYMAEEIIGKSIKVLIPSEYHAEEDTILERIRRGQRIDHYETIRQRKHGSLINISLTVSPVRNLQGKIIGASKIARDINRDCQLVFPVGEFQRVQCVLERCDQNLHVFGREGMIVFEKEANRHGGLHSATYTTGLATGSPANGHKCEDLVKKASFGALTLLQGRA